MKVLQVNITCGRGSTGRLAQALYEATIRDGNEARFAFSTFTPTLPNAYCISSPLLDVMRKGCNIAFGRRQQFSYFATRRLINYIKKEKPDLIHLHNIHHNMVNYFTLFSFLKTKNIPTVFTLHDCAFFTGGCYHYTTKHCDTFKNNCQNCPMGHAYDHIAFSSEQAYEAKRRLIGDNPNLYPVCVSDWLRREATASYMGAMAHPPRTIYNGIDTRRFYPEESDIRTRLGIPRDAFVVLSIAYVWDVRKGAAMLLKLRERLPHGCVLVLVGSGLEDLTGRYPNLICLPKTESQDELRRLYATADVFVNASLEETFGLTTAEALACGTPAVVFDSTACPELVDEASGLAIPHDEDALCQAVETIRRRGKDAYAPHCVQRAHTLFDQDRMVCDYINLYRSILHD
ncbi:MAG: glycosyltransferase [Clostridia bacterium]|nr:glycosyltransferase [Clostridia bacterium]